MKKVWALMITVTCSVAAFSQEVPSKVEKHLQDPQRKANAGKADVISTNKKTLLDTTTLNHHTEVINNKTSKTNSKKQDCGKRKVKTKAKKASLKQAK